MALDLYEILGVRKDAPFTSIKAAYRKLSKKYHPDMPGGSKETFHEIETAYRVLSDRASRDYYDQHGSVPPEAPQTNPNTELFGLLQRACMAAIQNAADVETVDVLDLMRDVIEQNIDMAKKQIEPGKASLAKIETLLKRVSAKDGEDVFTKIISAQHASLKARVDEGERTIALAQKAIEFLDGYEYEVTPPVPQMQQAWPVYNFSNLGNSQ